MANSLDSQWKVWILFKFGFLHKSQIRDLWRRTRAMHLYLAGVPLPLVSEWLGHSGMGTAFRYLKHAVGATDFHCKSFENVTHEVWARLILSNCCAAITALAVPEQSKYIYKVNYTMAVKNVHAFLRQKETETPIAIIVIIGKYTCPVRPGRYFDRRHRYQSPLKFGYRH